MFYFIPSIYEPNTAVSNRNLGFIRYFSQHGIETEVLFFRPDNDYSTISDKFDYISFRYLWKRGWIRHHVLCYISITFYLLWFYCHLRKGDKVFLIEQAYIWTHLLHRKGVDIYAEYTENPEVTGIGGRYLTPSYPKFYECCTKLSGLFVISTTLKEWFTKHGVASEKIHIVNMTVDPARFQSVKKEPSVRYIAYCGTVSNNKDGVDQLIRAFSITHHSFPDVKLYIIGKAPERTEACANRDLVKELGMEESVVFTGIISASEMPQILKNAEVLALARPANMQAQYGFPTKLGEYLLTGNPVVVTAVGDIPLFLHDGENALVAIPDDPEAFAEKLNWVLSHHDEAIIIGEKGCKTALQSFNSEIETEKIVRTVCQN